MPSLARSVPKPLKRPSLARSAQKPQVPSLARSVHKPPLIFALDDLCPSHFQSSLLTSYQLLVLIAVLDHGLNCRTGERTSVLNIVVGLVCVGVPVIENEVNISGIRDLGLVSLGVKGEAAQAAGLAGI